MDRCLSLFHCQSPALEHPHSPQHSAKNVHTWLKPPVFFPEGRIWTVFLIIHQPSLFITYLKSVLPNHIILTAQSGNVSIINLNTLIFVFILCHDIFSNLTVHLSTFQVLDKDINVDSRLKTCCQKSYYVGQGKTGLGITIAKRLCFLYAFVPLTILFNYQTCQRHEYLTSQCLFKGEMKRNWKKE